ncbi:MAG: ABC transporter ATP-binding protein/permease [Defluviitaleaceae bacterium]|nr:ABC transporter ATP-binding protein/permease [Defluviitaleaceae bacterium]MCL2239875.1 ABC transporter ATP-binding protein/permease [Defluviitaleaceae bacterium]
MKILTLCKPYLLAHKYALGVYVGLTLATVAITILSPYILGDFIDDLIQGADMHTISRFCLIFGGLNLLRIVKGYFSAMLYVKMQNRMGYSFNKNVIQHIQRVSLSYINQKDIAYLSSRVTSDANSLIGFCVSVLQSVLTHAILLVVPFFVLFSLNRFISLLMLAFLGVYVILYFTCKKKLYEVSLAMREKQATFFSGLLEQLKYIKLIKTNAIQKEINARADGHFTGFDKTVIRNQRVNYLYSGMDGIISTLAQIALFVVGGLQILYGNFTIGMFTIFTSYFNLILGATRYFYGLGASYQNALAAYDRMAEILGQRAEGSGTMELDGIQRITLDNVGFAYSAQGEEAVRGFGAAFTQGNIYAITGANGAGKSTLISLVMGLYADEYTGTIAYNHTDIREINMASTRRRHIGFAEQESTLIHDTIGYNLTYTSDANRGGDERLNALIEILDMNAFFEKHGLDFEINEMSNNISGGERQKISILKVLYKNPDVMIFDEPTAALDAATTTRFMDYLSRIKAGKIIIVITHDAAFKAGCDRVILI